jgi:hypothetical protein
MDDVVAHLRRLGRRVPELLQAPLSNEELQLWEAKFPFSMTRELEAIFSWRNGTKAREDDLLEDLYLFPGFYLLSIEEAYETYLERKDAPQWREGWFPLFADGAGDFYILPCGDKQADSSVVIGFLHGEPEQIAEYDSLAAMAATLEAAFAQRAFYVDTVDDSLEIDDDSFGSIAARFNPGIPEWRS